MNYIIVFLVVLAVILGVTENARYRRRISEIEAMLRRIYASTATTPRLNVSSAHGYPVFKVIFPSRAECQAAEEAGLNQVFTREIEAVCKDRAPKHDPFTSDDGVFFIWEAKT